MYIRINDLEYLADYSEVKSLDSMDRSDVMTPIPSSIFHEKHVCIKYMPEGLSDI
jgi:hypothetical protein